MKYLLLFLITFSIQAETWIVTAHNELHGGYYGCHPKNETNGNGCIKFNSEICADIFIAEHEFSWGKKERWLKEHELRPELMGRIIDERTINPKSVLEQIEIKVKSFIGIKSDIVPSESYTEYLVKSDYTFKIKDITKEIEKIEIELEKEETEKEEVKNINVDNMTDQEMKRILKQLLKSLK